MEEHAQATDQLIRSIEVVINESLFGVPGSPSNWKFPLNEDGTMAPKKLSNWCARRVVQHINALVEKCFPHEADHNQWNNIFTLYTSVVEVCIVYTLLIFIKNPSLIIFPHSSDNRICNKKKILVMMISLISKIKEFSSSECGLI